MRAEPPAQRGVQEMRGRVVGLGRVAERRVDARDHALARLELALVDLDDDGLVLAAAELDDVDDARPAVAVLALDHPDVGDLPAAGGVERRLGELDDHPPVVAHDRAHGRVRLQRLIAHELRRRPLQP